MVMARPVSAHYMPGSALKAPHAPPLTPSLPPYRPDAVILPGFVGWTLRPRDQTPQHGQSQGLDPGTRASEAEPANSGYSTSRAGEPSFEVDTLVPSIFQRRPHSMSVGESGWVSLASSLLPY